MSFSTCALWYGCPGNQERGHVEFKRFRNVSSRRNCGGVRQQPQWLPRPVSLLHRRMATSRIAAIPSSLLMVNGAQHRALARPTQRCSMRCANTAPHRHQEGLRPRPVRRVHRDRRRPADQFVPHARGDARGRRDHDDRRARHAGENCIRCRPPSSKHDGYQCGYCTPGQICSAVAMLDEIKAASRAMSTPISLRAPSSNLGDARADER